MPASSNQKPSEAIRRHQEASGGIRSHQKPQKAISSHQQPSVAIRSHQTPSEGIRSVEQVVMLASRLRRRTSGSMASHPVPMAIVCSLHGDRWHVCSFHGNRMAATTAQSNGRHLTEASHGKRQSEAIRGHQKPSEAIRSSHLTEASHGKRRRHRLPPLWLRANSALTSCSVRWSRSLSGRPWQSRHESCHAQPPGQAARRAAAAAAAALAASSAGGGCSAGGTVSPTTLKSSTSIWRGDRREIRGRSVGDQWEIGGRSVGDRASGGKFVASQWRSAAFGGSQRPSAGGPPCDSAVCSAPHPALDAQVEGVLGIEHRVEVHLTSAAEGAARAWARGERR